MSQTVIGIFDNASDANKAVDELRSNGFTDNQIDIRNNSATADNATSYDRTSTSTSDSGENGVTRFFKSLFGDNDDEVSRYSRATNSAQSIVTVHANSEDEAQSAADVLDEYGAVDVNDRTSDYDNTSNTTNDTSNTAQGVRSDVNYDRNNAVDSGGDTTLERIEENLQVGKRTVETGGARIRSRIVEKPVEEHVRLRQEHINIERTPVDRVVSTDRGDAFQEKNIELTERSEVPVVNKEARVVEEIRISKDVNEKDEVVRDTVRNTEIDIDQDRGDDATRRNTDTRNSTDSDYRSGNM